MEEGTARGADEGSRPELEARAGTCPGYKGDYPPGSHFWFGGRGDWGAGWQDERCQNCRRVRVYSTRAARPRPRANPGRRWSRAPRILGYYTR